MRPIDVNYDFIAKIHQVLIELKLLVSITLDFAVPFDVLIPSVKAMEAIIFHRLYRGKVDQNGVNHLLKGSYSMILTSYFYGSKIGFNMKQQYFQNIKSKNLCNRLECACLSLHRSIESIIVSQEKSRDGSTNY